MNFRHLKYFIATAELGQVSRAATALSISQSSITSAIRELETELGTKLFRRTAQGMDMTDSGREFLASSREILTKVEDAKKLTKRRREQLFAKLLTTAAIGVGVAEPEEIDRANILWATMAAMSRAVAALPLNPDIVLIDGNRTPDLACAARAVIKGDAISVSIAAASIIAKVTRDRLMAEADARWPVYGFAGHAGYPTQIHRDALKAHGPCPIHRRSFAPVKAALGLS